MVSRYVLQVSFFIVTLCWTIVLAPYLTEYYFVCANASESLGDVFSMLTIITFVIAGIPYFCFALCNLTVDNWTIDD
jgi:hypothetical protein